MLSIKLTIQSLPIVVLSLSSCAVNPESMSGHSNHEHPASKEMNHMSQSQGSENHQHHREMLEKKYKQQKYQKSVHSYAIENIPLLRMDNKPVMLADELANNRPIILNFIFTSCTTVCPVLSATFSKLQDQLGDEAEFVKMISISIDPEFDTTTQLNQYAKKFDAGSQWQFYTGTAKQSIKAQRAFAAYRGGKMNHIPLTFLRAPGSHSWVRLEGFTSSSELLEEYQHLPRS